MFRKFDPTNDVSTSTQVKSSVVRALKSQILENHPAITEEQLNDLLPKKAALVQYKVGPHLKLYCRQVNSAKGDDDDDNQRRLIDEPVFFQHRDGPILPCLKLVHQYPTVHFQSVTVDKGAIPYLLGGANVMCPGLTNPGGQMPSDGDDKDAHGFDKPGLDKGAGVVIFAEGKEYAIAVGVMTMSSADVRSKNKGIAIELMHNLGDGLYQTDENIDKKNGTTQPVKSSDSCIMLLLLFILLSVQILR